MCHGFADFTTSWALRPNPGAALAWPEDLVEHDNIMGAMPWLRSRYHLMEITLWAFTLRYIWRRCQYQRSHLFIQLALATRLRVPTSYCCRGGSCYGSFKEAVSGMLMFGLRPRLFSPSRSTPDSRPVR